MNFDPRVFPWYYDTINVEEMNYIVRDSSSTGGFISKVKKKFRNPRPHPNLSNNIVIINTKNKFNFEKKLPSSSHILYQKYNFSYKLINYCLIL